MMDGCDQTYGNCTCKRNVIGQNCDQCRPQHYGLSENDPLGCQPCDCDIGGSADNDCDVLTGQCKCLQEIGGRRCDEVNDFHFTGSLDYLLFEGELANGSYMPVSALFYLYSINFSFIKNFSVRNKIVLLGTIVILLCFFM